MNSLPVIVVALANDANDHLAMLNRERKAISDALQQFEDNRYIRLHPEPSAGIDDIFGLFNRFADQIAIFHYAGHANGTALNLETAGGGNEAAHAGGLAQLMGASASLQLVFLNGCATGGQVQTLLGSGVKAVIATAVPVNDTMATEFAEQFYQALAARKTIKQAFDAACALIASRYGDAKPIKEFRGFRMGDEPAAVDAALTWGLYYNPEAEATLGWTLPEQAENTIVVQSTTATVAAADTPVNDGLVQTLFNAIAPHSMEVGMAFEITKRTGKPDMRTIRQLIMDAFPRPIGEQLRKLLNSFAIDMDRLKQLIVTYESVIKLFAFAMLSQLWDALRDKPDLVVSDEQWASIDAYKALNAKSEKVFDYLGLVVAINGILDQNGISAFLAETKELQAQLTDAETSRARAFLDGIRAKLANEEIPAGDVNSLCRQAEAELSVIMSDFAFVVAYKLATIKSIAVSQSRNQPPQFKISQVLLDRISADPLDEDAMRPGYTEIQSVILLKDLEDVSRFLSLTPFVIDQNALTGDILTKLYFYSHREGDGAGKTDHYYFISNPADRLDLSDGMDPKLKPHCYESTRNLLQEFRDKVVRP